MHTHNTQSQLSGHFVTTNTGFQIYCWGWGGFPPRNKISI